MGYSALWKVLENMVADFRKRHTDVPLETLNDLKSAKTIIKLAKSGLNNAEYAQKIEILLGNVEHYLVSEGQKRFGNEYSEEWLKRISEASATAEEDEEKTSFVSGFPREQKWIRIKPSRDLPVEKLKLLVEDANLSCKLQNDGFLLVYGKGESLREFVRKIATKYGLKA
mgnify:CR=1 FL=1